MSEVSKAVEAVSELPVWVRDVVLAGEFPRGEAGGMRRMAAAWRIAAARCVELAGAVRVHGSRVEYSTDVSGELGASMLDQVGAFAQSLDNAGKFYGDLAEQAEGEANEVEKIQVEILVCASVALCSMLGGPGGLAAVERERLRVAALVRALATGVRTRGAVSVAGRSGVMFPVLRVGIVQGTLDVGVQMSQRYRTAVDWSSALTHAVAEVGSAIGGAVGGQVAARTVDNIPTHGFLVCLAASRGVSTGKGVVPSLRVPVERRMTPEDVPGKPSMVRRGLEDDDLVARLSLLADREAADRLRRSNVKFLGTPRLETGGDGATLTEPPRSHGDSMRQSPDGGCGSIRSEGPDSSQRIETNFAGVLPTARSNGWLGTERSSVAQVAQSGPQMLGAGAALSLEADRRIDSRTGIARLLCLPLRQDEAGRARESGAPPFAERRGGSSAFAERRAGEVLLPSAGYTVAEIAPHVCDMPNAMVSSPDVNDAAARAGVADECGISGVSLGRLDRNLDRSNQVGWDAVPQPFIPVHPDRDQMGVPDDPTLRPPQLDVMEPHPERLATPGEIGDPTTVGDPSNQPTSVHEILSPATHPMPDSPTASVDEPNQPKRSYDNDTRDGASGDDSDERSADSGRGGLSENTDVSDVEIHDSAYPDVLRDSVRSDALGAVASAPYHRQTVEIGDIALHPPSRVLVDGLEIELTAKEFEILRVLVGNAGRPVPTAEIIQALQADFGAMAPGSARFHINRMRRKIAADRRITFVTGAGYRFDAGWGSRDSRRQVDALALSRRRLLDERVMSMILHRMRSELTRPIERDRMLLDRRQLNRAIEVLAFEGEGQTDRTSLRMLKQAAQQARSLEARIETYAELASDQLLARLDRAAAEPGSLVYREATQMLGNLDRVLADIVGDAEFESASAAHDCLPLALLVLRDLFSQSDIRPLERIVGSEGATLGEAVQAVGGLAQEFYDPVRLKDRLLNPRDSAAAALVVQLFSGTGARDVEGHAAAVVNHNGKLLTIENGHILEFPDEQAARLAIVLDEDGRPLLPLSDEERDAMAVVLPNQLGSARRSIGDSLVGLGNLPMASEPRIVPSGAGVKEATGLAFGSISGSSWSL